MDCTVPTEGKRSANLLYLMGFNPKTRLITDPNLNEMVFLDTNFSSSC